MNSEISKNVANALARNVELFAEMFRQFGYAFPREYDLGLKASARRMGWAEMIDLKVRVDDVSVHRSVQAPTEASMDAVDEFRRSLEAAALDVVTRYATVHKEHTADKGQMEELIAKLTSDDGKTLGEMCVNAAHAARTAIYTEV